MNDLFEVEVASYDWANLQCACGRTASHLPELFRTLRGVESFDEARAVGIQEHLASSETLYAPALPAVRICLAALASDMGSEAHNGFLYLLLGVTSGDGQSLDAFLSGRDLPEECRVAAREGIWLLYEQVFHAPKANASQAFCVLALIENNQDRVEAVRVVASGKLAPNLRPS